MNPANQLITGQPTDIHTEQAEHSGELILQKLERMDYRLEELHRKLEELERELKVHH